MKTAIVQQISKDEYLKDVERLQVLKSLLWACSMKIEVQKAFIVSGDSLFKSPAEARLIIVRYERLYSYLRQRIFNTTIKMLDSI